MPTCCATWSLATRADIEPMGATESESDEELIRRAQRELPYGAQAFEKLAARHYDRIRKIATGIVGHADDADSISQDVMLRVYHNLKSLQSPAHFNGWLRQIIANTCNSWFAREKRERDKAGRLADALGPDAELYDAADAGADGFAALIGALSPEERTILAFKFVEDLEFNEIADIVGMGLSATKMRYYRAIEKIRGSAAGTDVHGTTPPADATGEHPGRSAGTRA
jgi:RNA polymerase sigma-70 factor, ECF subfamily